MKRILRIFLFFSLLLNIGLCHGAWRDWWLRKDQQGMRLLKSGKADVAAKTFESGDWQAVANYKSQNYTQAQEAFGQKNDATSNYNMGNALALQGKYEEAIASYDKALEQSPNMADAVYNREIVKKLLEQEKKKPKDKQKEKKDNQKDKDKDKNKDKKDQKKDDQNKDNNKDQQNNKDQKDNQQNSPQSKNQNDNSDKQPPNNDDGDDKGNNKGNNNGENKNQSNKEGSDQDKKDDQGKDKDKNNKPGDKKDQGKPENNGNNAPQQGGNLPNNSPSQEQKQEKSGTKGGDQPAEQQPQQQPGQQDNSNPMLSNSPMTQGSMAKEEKDKEGGYAAKQKQLDADTDQWLQQIPDDPGGLLRRKIMRDHIRKMNQEAED